MRSYLFVPGDSERKLEKSVQSGADCLLIDLEDSVSATHKIAAREMAAAFIKKTVGSKGTRPYLTVRVNALSSGLAADDLSSVIPSRPDGILLPKSEGGMDVQRLSVMIAIDEARAGIEEGATDIHALITESAIGILNAGTYAGVSDRLKSLSWGGEDLAADIGAQSNRDDSGCYTDIFRLARANTILAAAAASVDAVDSVFVDFRDEAGLERECLEAVRDGFTGKMAIHPSQVPVINRIFTPSAEAIEKACRIVDLFESSGPDAGVMSLDGKMVDQPHLKLAKRILGRARDAGLDV
jgi:citrate lyase subunit beta/citryl-CoA lyase